MIQKGGVYLGYKLGCVIMAAGNATRFGGNKLLATVGGKPMIEWALEAVPESRFSSISVVTQYPLIAELAQLFDFSVLENNHPDWGISHTISLGLSSMTDCDAVLFQVADQPMLQCESIETLLDAYEEYPQCILCLSHNGKRGNPCLFPQSFYPELLALEGDQGGNAVIQNHPEAIRLIECCSQDLYDVDVRSDLAQFN